MSGTTQNGHGKISNGNGKASNGHVVEGSKTIKSNGTNGHSKHDYTNGTTKGITLSKDPKAITKANKFVKPAIVEWWLTYAVPFKLSFDICLMLFNSKGWNLITKDWNEPLMVFWHLLTYSLDENVMHKNEDHMFMVRGIQFLMIFENIDMIIMLYYRQQYSKTWHLVGIHHVLLNIVFGYFLYIGKFLPLCSAIMSLSHVWFLPTAIFRKWKYWKSDRAVWWIAGWSIIGKTVQAIGYIWVMPYLLTYPPFCDSLGWRKYMITTLLTLMILHYGFFIEFTYLPALRQRGMIGPLKRNKRAIM